MEWVIIASKRSSWNWVLVEKRGAWRLSGGGWVKIKTFSDRMDQCNKHMVTLPAELTDEMPR